MASNHYALEAVHAVAKREHARAKGDHMAGPAFLNERSDVTFSNSVR